MKRPRARFLAAAFGAAALLPVSLAARDAHACGGFFCATTPIDQSGEYILFSIEEEGVRAYIQVQYQGKAEDFAWVVPVMSAPTKVGVGVQQVFTSLMAATAPRFQINWNLPTNGSCAVSAPSASMGPTADAGVLAGGGVNVVSQGEVGPYDYVVVEAKDAGLLTMWLTKNGFQQPPSATTALAHYVQQNFVFVAIKLKRDAEVGEIQPLVLDMPHQEACVPLVLTRIAAVPDMPIYAMVLGKHRAVPRNWFEVSLNLRKIDWWSAGSNYRRVVTDAINEAQGRAFITESAGPTARFANTLWSPGRFDTTFLRTQTTPAAFVQTMFGLGLPRDPIVQSLLRKYIPMPASVKATGVPEAQFYNQLSSYSAQLAGQPFDPVAFTKELDERVITPLREAQQMVDRQAYFTRMFTTVSPEEMTRDPLFDLNPDLGPVDNVHVATATGACASDGNVSNVKLAFADGTQLDVPGKFVRWQGPPQGARTAPAAEASATRIALVGPRGAAIPVSMTKVSAFDKALDSLSPEIVRALALQEPPPADAGSGTPDRRDAGAPVTRGADGPTTDTPPIRTGGGGCAAAGGTPAGGAFPLVVALWLAARRKRRNASRSRSST